MPFLRNASAILYSGAAKRDGSAGRPSGRVSAARLIKCVDDAAGAATLLFNCNCVMAPEDPGGRAKKRGGGSSRYGQLGSVGLTAMLASNEISRPPMTATPRSTLPNNL